MKKHLLIASAALMLPVCAVAEQSPQSTRFIDYVGGSISFVDNDAASGSDFDASARFNGFVEKRISENLSLQLGLSQSSDAEHVGDDNTGEYKFTISHSDVFGGVKFTFNPLDQFRLFARGGFLYYYSQIELEESFFGEKESGVDEEIEEGTGFYVGGGAAINVSPELHMEFEVSHLKRSDYFEDASRAFDFEETGITVGIVYKLP